MVALSGILLVGSILVPSTSQALVVHSAIKPLSLASNYTATNISQFLNQQTRWNTVTLAETTTALESKQAQSESVHNITNSPSNVLRSMQVAQIVAREAPPETHQISRGSNSAIVEHALSLLGTPYVFGGTTLRGIDCSGFTQYVFAGSGISLPRTSYEQFASGVAVSKNELQAGDLVFFTTYSKGASHVGIYIGGGRFVQADNPHVGVTITSLSNSFYAARYLGARRYL